MLFARSFSRTPIPWLCIALAGCGSDAAPDSASNQGSVDGGDSSGLDAMMNVPDGGEAGGSSQGGSDTGCGATAIAIEALPPDLLVVFDRSCSMRRLYESDEAGEFGSGPDDPMTRWGMARNALDQIMAQYEARIRFGLMAFPRPYEGCGDAPNVNVLPALANRADILDKLQQLNPFELCPTGLQPGETPTGEALAALLDQAIFNPAERAAYVLVMTDGLATCDATAESLGQLVSAIRAAGAKTAAVGFGDIQDPKAAEMMNAIGKAGEVKTSPPWYWYAENPAGLFDAIATVVQDAVSCAFKLGEQPPDPDKLYAYLDGSQVAADPIDGWTYDPGSQTLTFHGASCEKLQEGGVKNVSVVFGCPDSECPPSDEVCDGFDNDCDGEVDEQVCPK